MKFKIKYIISILIFCCLILLSSFIGPPTQKSSDNSKHAAYGCDIDILCACQEPEIKPIFPFEVEAPLDTLADGTVTFGTDDISRCGDQPCHSCFVCMGWQLFVYMNWPANPDSTGKPDHNKTSAVFGNPYDDSPLVWETYKNVHDVFSDEKPTPWGAPGGERIVDGVQESERVSFENLQADNTWLIDKNGNMVFYELFMNDSMFNYVFRNGYYNQQGILSAYKDPQTGSYEGKTGISLPNWSCEIKASWMIVPLGEEDVYRERYKLTQATVPDWKNDGAPIKVTLALVGMHINEKTPKMPNWAWFTFEHVDNCPDSIQIANNIQTPIQDGKGHNKLDANGDVLMDNSTLKNSYNLFNPNLPVDNCPNYLKPPRDCPDPANKFDPVQVARLDPITIIPHSINNAMHELIKKKNANSIWQYYVMVNPQWSKNPVTPDPMSDRALPTGDPRPDYVANTTMETYMQPVQSGGMATHSAANGEPTKDVRGKSSCIRCHSISATTPSWDVDLPGVNRNKDYFWTDYSAVFFKAKYHKPVEKK